tara:strand:- start:518 stop:4309 length:3792 start_codon:yes stop_codon:yes gene_type:complete
MGKCDWDEVVVPEKHCNWVGVTDDSNSGWTIPPIDFEDDDDGDDDDIDGEEGGDSEGVPPWYCVEYAGTDGAGYKQCENPPGDGVIVDGPFADMITCIEICVYPAIRWYCMYKGTPQATCVGPMEFKRENAPPIDNHTWFSTRLECEFSCKDNTTIVPTPGVPIDYLPWDLWECNKDQDPWVCKIVKRGITEEDVMDGDGWKDREPPAVDADGNPDPDPGYYAKDRHGIWGVDRKKWAKAQNPGGFVSKADCEPCKKPTGSLGTPGGAATPGESKLFYWKCVRPCTVACGPTENPCDRKSVLLSEAKKKFPYGTNKEMWIDASTINVEEFANAYGGFYLQEECEEFCIVPDIDEEDGRGPVTGGGAGGDGEVVDTPGGGGATSGEVPGDTPNQPPGGTSEGTIKYYKCVRFNSPCAKFEENLGDIMGRWPRYGDDTPDDLYTNNNEIDPKFFAAFRGGYLDPEICAKKCQRVVTDTGGELIGEGPPDITDGGDFQEELPDPGVDDIGGGTLIEEEDPDITDGGDLETVEGAGWVCTNPGLGFGCEFIDRFNSNYPGLRRYTNPFECGRLCGDGIGGDYEVIIIESGGPPEGGGGDDDDWVPTPNGGFVNGYTVDGGSVTCNPECVYTPPFGMHWVCDSSEGVCKPWAVPPKGTRSYSDPFECMANCYKAVDNVDENTANPIFTGNEGGTNVDTVKGGGISNKGYLRYVCIQNADGTKSCELQSVEDSTIGFVKEDDCNRFCRSTSTNDMVLNSNIDGVDQWGWGCNINTGNCEYMLGGIHATEQACSIIGCHEFINTSTTKAGSNEVPRSYGWECNPSTGKCEYIVNGSHGSKDECNNLCSPPINVNIPAAEGLGFWRWVCKDSTCTFQRVSNPNDGHVQFNKCAEACEGGGDPDGTIIISSNNYGGMSQENEVSRDSFIQSGDGEYSASFDNRTIFVRLLDILNNRTNKNGFIKLDYAMPTLLSNFFVDYPYNYAIVDKSKFIKLLKRSINVKGSDFILIRPERLVSNLKLFVFALNRNDMIGLNIHHLHRFWSTIKPADVKIDDTTPIIIDVDGNSIIESGFSSFEKSTEKAKESFDEPTLLNSDMLNDPIPVETSTSFNVSFENSKITIGLAINKLAARWREGLNTIANTKPLKDQPFIPKDMDNLSQLISEGVGDDKKQVRNIYGNINNSKIALSQDVTFQVPNVSDPCNVQYSQFKIDFRSNLTMNAPYPLYMYGKLSLKYKNNKIFTYIEGFEQPDVTVTSKDSIVMSVFRKATRKG